MKITPTEEDEKAINLIYAALKSWKKLQNQKHS